MKWSNQKGFSYIEVVISLVIIISVMQIFFLAIHYAYRQYTHFRQAEEATLYGKEFMKYISDTIDCNIDLDSIVLNAYMSKQIKNQKDYQYSMLIVPETDLASSLKDANLERSIKLSTDEAFDFNLFKELIQQEKIAFQLPTYKQSKPLYYEGLRIKITPSKTLVPEVNRVREEGTTLIEMQVEYKEGKWKITLTPTTLLLDANTPILIEWDNMGYLRDRSIQVELVNHTPCKIILGVVGEIENIQNVKVSTPDNLEPVMIKSLREPIKYNRYLIVELVTIKTENNYKVLKNYVVFK